MREEAARAQLAFAPVAAFETDGHVFHNGGDIRCFVVSKVERNTRLSHTYGGQSQALASAFKDEGACAVNIRTCPNTHLDRLNLDAISIRR